MVELKHRNGLIALAGLVLVQKNEKKERVGWLLSWACQYRTPCHSVLELKVTDRSERDQQATFWWILMLRSCRNPFEAVVLLKARGSSRWVIGDALHLIIMSIATLILLAQSLSKRLPLLEFYPACPVSSWHSPYHTQLSANNKSRVNHLTGRSVQLRIHLSG